MTGVGATTAIGGAFEIDLVQIAAAEATATPVALGGGVSVTSGRTALALAVEKLRAEHWLVPAYLCTSVLQPLHAAGVNVVFYPVGDDLEPKLDELERTVGAHPESALLVIDYFGFPPRAADELAGLAAHCTIVEDCVQGSLVETTDAAGGALGSIAFTSFRKFLPVPDGGVIRGVDPVDLPRATGPAVTRRLLGQLLRGASGAKANEHTERVFLRLLDEGESALDLDVPLRSTSSISRHLLAGVDLPAAAAQRRRNFEAMLEALGERDLHAFVTPLRTSLPPGVSPLVLPVRVGSGRRDAVRSGLSARRIFCPVHWPLPADVDLAAFPAEHRLSEEILGLPIDQRYRSADMTRVAEELAGVLGVAA